MFKSNSLVNLLILFVTTRNCVIGENEEETPMLRVLNAMQQMMTGEDYDLDTYTSIRSCMDSMDKDTLKNSHDGAWQGMIDYWHSNGDNDTDYWGSYETSYMENPVSEVTELDNMEVYEPCGYASNMAFYSALMEVCERSSNYFFSWSSEYDVAIARGLSMMAFGSSLMHGTHTELGHQQDVASMKITLYIIHQASLAPLGTNSSVLMDINDEPREKSAIELIDDVTQMYIERNVSEWYEHVKAFDLPGYVFIIATLFTTSMTLVFEQEKVDSILPPLLKAAGLSQNDQTFILESYLPELRAEIVDLQIPPKENVKFTGNVIGMAVKFLYALVWQEETLPFDFLLTPEANNWGWEHLPPLNMRAGQLQSFLYYNADFQSGTNVYPGDMDCNPLIPHAKWHLESAIGMLDFAYVGDNINWLLASFNGH